MNWTFILLATAVVGVLGLLLGLALSFAGEKLSVKVDEKQEHIRHLLPSNNCGGCGYAGCDALAEAIFQGKARPSACPVGGNETAEKIAAVLGVTAERTTPAAAYVRCAGSCDHVKTVYQYGGIQTCHAAMQAPLHGEKGCAFACIGYGDCVNACQFGALSIQNGVAKVDSALCKACGVCTETCPQRLITLIPQTSRYAVTCHNPFVGKAVRAQCSAGCIGCKLCTTVCEAGAIAVHENLAAIDPTKCIGCGKCAEKCPTKAIQMT